jgi:hypothetical protein
VCIGLETEQELSLIPADRRRLTVATLITVAALPTLWLVQRDPSSPGTAGVAVAGPTGGVAIAGPGDAVTSTEMTSTESPSTSGPSVILVTQPATTSAPTTTTISADHRRTGTATYKRYSGYGISNPCMAPLAPVNSTITVRSLNSGRSIECVNVVEYTPLPEPDIVVVVNTDTFLEMADTRDAPVAVEISW